jgi:hypothetical protein
MKPIARLDRGFRSYLQKLIDSGRLKKEYGKVSLGVTEQVLNDGIETLTARQAPVFYDYVIGRLVINKCGFCKNDIRWSEMYAALDNGGYCKDCAKKRQEVLKKKAAQNKKSK